MIGDETRRHEAELSALLVNELTSDQRAFLDELFDKEGDSDASRMKLTLLKRFSQSTTPRRIQANVDDLRTIRGLFDGLEHVIQALDLTQEGMRHYASSVIKARVHQVSRRSQDDRHLHLVCFVGHQYFRLQDTLVDALLTSVQNSENSCKREHKEQHYGERNQQRKSLRTFIKSVDRGAFSPLAEIESIAFDHELMDGDKVDRIQMVFESVKKERKSANEQLSNLTQLTNCDEDASYFDILESKSVKLQNRVSGILKELAFEKDDSALASAVAHFKEANGNISETAPTSFLTEGDRNMLSLENGKFRVSLYKAVLFVAVANAIKAGAITCDIRTSIVHWRTI